MANSPSDTPKVQLGIGVDSTEAERNLDGLGKKFENLGTTVEKISDSSGRSFEKVTTSANRVSTAVEKATNSLAASVKRATDEQSRALAELQAGGKNTVEYFQKLGEIRGVDTAKLDPIINKLNDVRSAIAAAQAKQEEFSASRAFDKKVEDARRLNQASEYVRFWTDSLDKAEAKEKEFASVAAFEKKHQDAKKFVQDAEYVKFWTAELEKADAVQARLATNNSFVERLKKESEAIGKTRADLLELQAAQMGLTRETAPYIAKLREQEGAINKAGKQMNEYGMSAKQTAAALRQVPAQFTDIIVSLQGGQAPLTVLLQQGGQLKDVFGGAGVAARALGGYIAGLITPFTTLAAAVGVLAYGYFKGSAEAEAFNKTLILTGNAAGTSAGQLSRIASSLDKGTTTQAKAAEVLNIFAQTGKIGAENFERFAKAAIEFEKVGGGAVEDIAKNFESLAKSPLQSTLRLNETMNYLTRSTYEQIKALEEQGKTTEAAKLAQEAYAASLENMTPKLLQNLGYVEKAWLGIKGAISQSVDAILEIGRQSDPGQLLGNMKKQLADMEADQRQAALLLNKPVAGDTEKMKMLREQISLAQKALALEADRNNEVKAGNEALKKRADWDKDSEQYKTKAIKMAEEIKKVENESQELIRRGLITEKDLRDRIAAIRLKYAETGGQDEVANIQAKIVATKEYIENLKTQGLQEAKLNEGERLALQFKEQLKGQLDAVSRKNKEIALQRANELATLQKQAENIEVGIKVNLQTDEVLRSARELSKLYDDEMKFSGLTALERQKIVAQRQVELKYAKLIADLDKQALTDAQKTEQKTKLLGAQMIEQSAAVNKVIQDDFNKTAEQINQSLTDALMRGFESGSSFAQNFKSTLENMFKTMVLRPVISAILAPVSGALAAGFSGNAAAASQSGNILSQASSVNSLYNLLNTGVANSIKSGFGQLATSSFGQSIGLSTEAAGPLTSSGAGSATMTPQAMQMGNALAAAGNAIAGYAIQKTISGGYKTGESKTVDAITLAASAYFGPIAGVAAGVFNRAFGRKLADVGLQGTFGGEQGFTGENYTFEKGGFLTNDRTRTSSLSSQTQTALAGQFRSMQVSTALMAQTLGQGTESIQNFTKDIKLSLSGLTGEQVVAKLNEEVSAINETLAGLALGTADFNKLGESNVDALNRLSTGLTTVNAAFEILGNTMYDSSLAGADLASQLVDLFGGLDAFTQATSSYYDAFYSDAEKTAKATSQVSEALLDLNYAMPSTKEQFRAIVDAQDLTTASGRETYASLIKLSGAFSQVTDAAETTANELYANSQRATDTAFASLKRSVDSASKAAEKVITDAYDAASSQLTAQRDLVKTASDVAKENVSTFKGVFDLLKNEIASLIGDTTASMSSLQGRAFIEQSIVTAQSTGYLPEQAQLSEAITAIKNGFEKTAYTSAFEQQRDRLVLASRLNELKLVAGEQMTTAEKQLKLSEDQIVLLEDQIKLAKTKFDEDINANKTYYQDMLDSAQEQIDIARGVDSSIKDVKTAVSDLASSIRNELSQAIASGNAAKTAAKSAASAPYSVEDTPAERKAKVESQTGVAISPSDSAIVRAAKVLYQSTHGGASTAEYNAAAAAVGGDIGKALNWDGSMAGTEKLRDTYGFAKGGYYQGGLALVGEQGPEIINFKNPGMVYTAGQTDSLLGGGEAMIAEVRGLREDNQAQARAMVQLQAKMNKLMERWDSDGLPEVRAVA